MSFVLYGGQQFHLEHWIEEYLAIAVASNGERKRLRAWLEATLRGKPATRPIGRQVSILARLVILAKTVLRAVIGKEGVTLLRRMVAGLTAHRSDGGPMSVRHDEVAHQKIRIVPGLRPRFSPEEWAALERDQA
jgi:hypothetical protein